LNNRTGLLNALNTRYGVFYFTDYVIIMDILPCDTREIFSFIYPRTPGKEPADDFCKLSNSLGSAWWDERKRSNRKYLANRHVLERAHSNTDKTGSIVPLETRNPSVRGTALISLRLDRSDLESPTLKKTIKQSFRTRAKRHHPDLGGDSAMFRRIHNAYEELMNWAESPTFTTRRGFQDKWFYSGQRNRWVQPTPLSK